MKNVEARRLKKYIETHKFIDSVEHKFCTLCKDWHPLNEDFFYKNKSNGIDGFDPYCIESAKLKTKKWQEDNYDQYRINSKKSDYLPSTKIYWKEKEKKRRDDGKYSEWQQSNPDKIRGYNLDRELHKKHEINNKEWEECKKYFNHRCAYCGLKIEEHWRKRKGKYSLYDLHKEHVDHNGKNDLSNCIPSCQSCNSEKAKKDMINWYTLESINFDQLKLNKIHRWLDMDYLKYFKITKFKSN